MKKNPILWAMLAVLLAFSLALVLGCDNGGGGGGGNGLTDEEMQDMKDGMEMMYAFAGEDWAEWIDEINAEIPGLNLPKTNPSTWDGAVWDRLAKNADKLDEFFGDEEGGEEGGEQGGEEGGGPGGAIDEAVGEYTADDIAAGRLAFAFAYDSVKASPGTWATIINMVNQEHGINLPATDPRTWTSAQVAAYLDVS
jgi:hypothetical protein